MSIFECGSECTTADKNAGRGCGDRQETYTGAVLCTYEENGYDDSDFVAIVWDATAGAVKTVCYASTRGWTYHNSAAVDASPDVVAAARAYLVAQMTARYVKQARDAAAVPAVGSRVRSLTTRGKNVGVVGVVRWFGEDNYRSTRQLTAYRVGVAVEGEDALRYLPADRVEVLDPAEPDMREVAARVAGAGWYDLAR